MQKIEQIWCLESNKIWKSSEWWPHIIAHIRQSRQSEFFSLLAMHYVYINIFVTATAISESYQHKLAFSLVTNNLKKNIGWSLDISNIYWSRHHDSENSLFTSIFADCVEYVGLALVIRGLLEWEVYTELLLLLYDCPSGT